MNSDLQNIHRLLMDAIDDATEPSKMSKADALSVLEELCTDVECRIEALKEEMGD